MAGKTQWVSPRGGGLWAVHGERNVKDTKVCRTQTEAIKCARAIAKNQHSELIIQDRKGRIRSKDSYGNDPCPPVDKEH
jgi:hypothetical protein